MKNNLPQSVLDFTNFLNEPPQYEELRMVREFRHEAWSKWEKVLADLLVEQANSSLIAAAPDLMEALRNLEFYISNCDDEPMTPRLRQRVKEARIAMAKAEGRPWE